MNGIPGRSNGWVAPNWTVLHVLAVVEACKGLLVLVVGLGLLAFIHRDLEAQAEEIVRFFHMDPARQIPRVFIETAAHLENPHLWLLSLAAFGYTAVKGVEAFGLWFDRAWAEWFAVVSLAAFIPFEIFELLKRPTPVRGTVLAINIGIAAYLSVLVYLRMRRRAASVVEARSEKPIGIPRAPTTTESSEDTPWT
jgi:uncharacterized membrane protein (DUF2068 family)